MTCSLSAWAGEVSVIKASARGQGGGLWTFSVTLRHADTGWEHYANAWDVRTPDGQVLGKRVLYHPHVDEQPFTRSLAGVAVPEELSEVVIFGHDSVHGASEEGYVLRLSR
ncbi:MAG: hypothetical protein ACPGOV_11965 [Magnetovibrionaceae bacterium]